MSAPVIIDVSKLETDKDRAEAVAALVAGMGDHYERRKQQERAGLSIAAFFVGGVVGIAGTIAVHWFWTALW